MDELDVGMKVVIEGYSHAGYSIYNIIGKEGVVTRLYGKENIGVSIEGIKNRASQYEIFWFKPSELRVIDEFEYKEDNKMTLKGFNKVVLVPIGSSTYAYALYDDGVEYKVGDTVMVSGTYHNPVKIEQILTADDPRLEDINITAEVICKLDYTAYNKRVADRERVKELIQEMDKKIKEIDEMNKYEIYAKDNPAIADMLKELKSLQL